MKCTLIFLSVNLPFFFTLLSHSLFKLIKERKDKTIIIVLVHKKKRKKLVANRKHHLLHTDIISDFLRPKARKKNYIESLFVSVIQSFIFLFYCRPNQKCEYRVVSFFCFFLSFLFFFTFSFSFSSCFVPQLNVQDGSRPSGHTHIHALDERE